MSLPASRDLKTLNYIYGGQPFCEIYAFQNVRSTMFNFICDGQPFLIQRYYYPSVTDPDRICKVVAEDRIAEILTDNRTIIVLSENRTMIIESE